MSKVSKEVLSVTESDGTTEQVFHRPSVIYANQLHTYKELAHQVGGVTVEVVATEGQEYTCWVHNLELRAGDIVLTLEPVRETIFLKTNEIAVSIIAPEFKDYASFLNALATFQVISNTQNPN